MYYYYFNLHFTYVFYIYISITILHYYLCMYSAPYIRLQIIMYFVYFKTKMMNGK